MSRVTPRTQARDEIKKKLHSDINQARCDVRANTYKINQLTEAQQKLKRKVTELYNLIKMMEKM
jgi:predicted RNase H-like nuclease (RuvC/YqgF family)